MSLGSVNTCSSLSQFEGFCRKYFAREMNGLLWAHLCCEGRELLERREFGLGQLAFADHVGDVNPG